MANLTVSCSTAANTLTENSATINRDRVVTGATESVTLVENVAVANATRKITGVTEAVTFTENPASVGLYEATISMSFSGMSAITAVVTTDLQSLVDTFTATESISGEFDFTLTDLIIAGDQTTALWINSETFVIEASEAITYDSTISYGDTVSASETIGPVIWDANLWPEPAVGSWGEKIQVFLSESITDTVNATDSFALIGRSLEMEDAFYVATPEITSSVEHTETLSATVDASEVLEPGASESLTTGNAVLVTGTITDTLIPNHTHADSFTATSSIVESAAPNATLIDIVNVIDTRIIASMTANQSIHETLTATEVLWASDFAALAWVLNTETAGLSTYDNFGFNSVAAKDGVLYATSPEGVFALNADADQTRNIDARVQTGMLDFDIKTTKQISDVFIGYTGGQLQYEVETYDGPSDVYTYEMPERDSDAPRNNRVKPGRGLRSRYWRFGIENIDGADFQLHDQVAVVAASKRRL